MTKVVFFDIYATSKRGLYMLNCHGIIGTPRMKSLPPKPLIPLFFEGAEDLFIRIPKKPVMSYKERMSHRSNPTLFGWDLKPFQSSIGMESSHSFAG